MAAVLRELLIQRYIFRDNERIIAQGKIVQPRDYTQNNAFKTQEDTWAKLGLVDLIENVMDPEKYKQNCTIDNHGYRFQHHAQHVCALRCSQPWTPFLRVHPRKLGHQAIRWKRRAIDQ